MSGASSTGPEATIDLSALRTNLELIRERVSPAALMTVVKADAYGHGLLPVSMAAVASGIDWLGTLDIATSLHLRRGGIPSEVKIFAWLLGPVEDYRSALEARIDLGVSTIEQLDQIAAAVDQTPARVHLKIDTGLHRNGASAEDWPPLVTRALELAPRIELVGAWTHIAEASESDDTEAITRFHEAVAVATALGARLEVRHLAASAASFARADARLDLVRVGAFGYGIAPGGGISPASLGLIPVMTLTAPIYSSHGARAVIELGSADGIPMAAVGREVALDDMRVPILEVCLDHLILDAPNARVGDTVTVWGSGRAGEATLQEWADALGTIGEELVTRLSPRIPRRFTS